MVTNSNRTDSPENLPDFSDPEGFQDDITNEGFILILFY